MEPVAKSYMRKGFLFYEEMHTYTTTLYMRRSLVIYDFATDHFLISKLRKLDFLFY
jgi:hypothetical protein